MAETVQITNLAREYLRNCRYELERADIELSQAMPDMEKISKHITHALNYYRLAFPHD
jgi:hypothetical protein